VNLWSRPPARAHPSRALRDVAAEALSFSPSGLKKLNSKSQIHTYPEAPHGFNADYRPSYRKDAAEDGWKRMMAWFKENGAA